MPPSVIGKCAACGKDVWTHKSKAPYAALTPNKADLLVAFYHLVFETKLTKEAMAAALEAGALIHNACVIQTNQVTGNPPLLAEYNRLLAKRDAALPPAAAFHNPDRSKAALQAKFASASHQQRAAPPRACATPAACDAPTTLYRHTDATSTSMSLPYVKGARHDPRTCIAAGVLERAVPSASWPALTAYLRGRRLVDRDQIAAFAGALVGALMRVAFNAHSVLEFFRTRVPALLAQCEQPGGEYLYTQLAHRAQLVAPAASTLLYASVPPARVCVAAAVVADGRASALVHVQAQGRRQLVLTSIFFHFSENFTRRRSKAAMILLPEAV
jgi:hypothetical protein